MCTNFLLNAGDTGYVNGRSMEFGLPLFSKLFFRAPGHQYIQRFHGPDFGYTWKGNYGFVGLNIFDFQVVTDGMNSEGLSTGALWLPGTQYPNITDKAKGLSIDSFCVWLLSRFASCAEVKEALNNGEVQVGAPKLLEKLEPLHFPVHDAQGKSIVVEFIGGQIQVYDNPVSVLTNDPFFEWQLENLRNYVSVTPWDAHRVQVGDLKVEPTGHGTGFIPLPGDSTPPSRFVRAAMMKTYSSPVENLDKATTLAFHILNTVDIPHGISRSKKALMITENDHTQWAVVKDLTRKILSVRFYDSPQVYSVDLNKINLSEVDGKQLPIPDTPKSIDLSGEVTEKALAVPEPKS